MKRQSKKQKTNRKPAIDNAVSNEDKPSSRNRRDFLLKARNGAVAIAVVSGTAWFVTAEVKATVQEKDLSRIGNGVATVVQIHDPQCPKCLALQREAREAFDAFDDSELQYLVANIRTAEGREFADKHQVEHVTLMLFDANGKRRTVLAGHNQASYLERAFRRHVERPS